MLHVLLETPSPRARYAVRHVFERMLGWPVDFVDSREALFAASGPRLSYGPMPVQDAFHVPPSGWLDGPRRSGMVPWSSGTGHDLVLFPIGSRSDVFAAIFHLISLEEEYTLTDRDEHGRIKANDLLLVRSGAHAIPIVDRWALRLAEELRTAFPTLPPVQRSYRHVLTVDVDNGLKYAARSWHRAMGASAKDLATAEGARFLERWRVRTGRNDDPYATFVDRLSEARTHVDRLIAFVLTRGEGRFDHAARLDHPVFINLLKRLSDVAEIGLHPSYGSSRDERMIARERDQLGRVTGTDPKMTRQHFLRWRMPGTFRALIANGFAEDHSIGFSDRAGFRAGTCTPFPWYDLERDVETLLMLHPFTVMDSALADHSGMDPSTAVGEMKRLCDAVREVRGTFTSVWHDRFLSGDQPFAGWPDALRDLVEYAKP